MTTAIGLAAVTVSLRHVLEEGLVTQNISGMLGSTVSVTSLPPDKVVSASGTEAPQLNLFLHRVNPNPGWRNEGLPSRDNAGRHRLNNAPLALDLHYLLTAYTGGDLHAEVLLGSAMLWLHSAAVLPREAIRRALTPPVLPGSPLERALAESGLAEQVELIKITPEVLDTEELSKLWTATQSHLRPTVAYRVTALLIEASDPVVSPLPVLTRGPVDPATQRERGIVVEPSLLAAVPTLETIEPSGKQPVARLNSAVVMAGHHLAGAARTVRLSCDRFDIEANVPALAGANANEATFTLPAADAELYPVGVYRVGLSVVRPGEAAPRESNRLAMTLAPQITGLPLSVVRAADGSASFSLNCLPAVRPGQTVSLLLGDQAFAPDAITVVTTTLSFNIEQAPVSPLGGHLARLRVDGIDSPVIDHAAQPPVFLNQRITVT